MNGVTLIKQERLRQIEEEGWLPDHDDRHINGELAQAAACYAASEPVFIHREAESHFFAGNMGDRGDRQLLPAGYYPAWPWDQEWYKPTPNDRVRQLVKAGALIAAEIDRLLRQEQA